MAGKKVPFAIKVIWLDGSEEYVLRGICGSGPIALFPNRERAEEQRAFMLEGIADEVQSINVVMAPEGGKNG